MIAPGLFKAHALRALKGNWQTALLISFLVGLPYTMVQLVTTRMIDVSQAYSMEDVLRAVIAVPESTIWLIEGLSLLAALLTPLLAMGCNHYFVSRVQGKELGLSGLFSRAGIFFKSLWLYFQMFVRVFAWSLLLVVPGVMAALRYSMAPYFLAEDPKLTAGEAIEKSKAAMDGQKASYLFLNLSFIGWVLAGEVLYILLLGLGVVPALVVNQCVSLFAGTYLNAACAVFYHAVSTPNGVAREQAELAAWMRQNGMGGVPPYGGPMGTANPDEPEAAPDDSSEDETENVPGAEAGEPPKNND